MINLGVFLVIMLTYLSIGIGITAFLIYNIGFPGSTVWNNIRTYAITAICWPSFLILCKRMKREVEIENERKQND